MKERILKVLRSRGAGIDEKWMAGHDLWVAVTGRKDYGYPNSYEEYYTFKNAVDALVDEEKIFFQQDESLELYSAVNDIALRVLAKFKSLGGEQRMLIHEIETLLGISIHECTLKAMLAALLFNDKDRIVSMLSGAVSVGEDRSAAKGALENLGFFGL